MVDIFKEVDEDLRRSQLQALWTKYGMYLIALLAGIVLAVGGYQYWQYHTKAVQARESSTFASALEQLEAGDRDAGLAALDDLRRNGSTGYRALAALREAAALAKGGEIEEAVKIYEAAAADSKVDTVLRDYAELIAISWLIETGSDDGVTGRLEHLAKPGAPWAALAEEMYALLIARQGDGAAAGERFDALAANQDVAPGVRQRAEELSAVAANR